MLSTGLPISRYVSVQVSLTTPGVTGPAINTCLIVGSATVIDAGERMRRYANITEVAGDFGVDAVEYKTADAWFSQNPRPDNVMVGRWLKAASAASLVGGVLAFEEQDISAWRDITDGSFNINTAGVDKPITALDFSAVGNLNGVASAINAKLTTAAASCVWNGEQFVFTTTATGPAATISYLTPITPTSGTNLSAMLKGDVTTAARVVSGAAPENALEAIVAIDGLYSSQFYGVIMPEAVEDDQLLIAAYVEACDPPHYFGVTTDDTNTIDSIYDTDLASKLAGFGYNKTAVQYSTRNPYAVASYLGRILTTEWRGSNTAITLMYKQEPGVTTENLSTQQADTLQGKNCNVYSGVSNNAQVIQYGTSASGEYTDTIIGADALALAVQAALFNTMYTTNTKIPQTDFGMGILTNSASAACSQYVSNGYLAPGIWNAPGFGEIVQGDLLPMGFYVWAPSMGDQDLADRAARRSPVIQIAAKCAGAIHSTDVVIFVNQ